MSNSRHLSLGLALLAALALAAQRAEAGTTRTQSPDEVVTALSSDRDGGDGRPPTTGPTNPAGF
jgi:hypothetical protein